MRFFRGNLRYRLARMMMGRNGPDTLYYIFFVLALLCSILQWWTDKLYPSVLSALFIGYALFRCFSRSIARRRAENAAFLRVVRKVTNILRPRSRRIYEPPKTHVFRKCPRCKSRLRLRYVPGKHTVRCPRCNGLFDVKIR